MGKEKILTLTAKGKNPAIFHDILTDCRQFFIEQTRAGTTFYSTMHHTWTHMGQKRKRPLESVILDEGVLEEILRDIEDFIASAQWYAERGIPYRRGHLVYGPLGCGKTSIISAIAAYLDYGISILSLSDKFMADGDLQNLINLVPQQSLLLLEDVDAAFQSRKTAQRPLGLYENCTSVSGLLNGIDGIASTDGRILFMTTNHINRLDSALIRPGRVDVKIKVDSCSGYQVRQFFRRFYPDLDSDESDSLIEEFLKKLRSGDRESIVDVSPAQLQGYFLLHRNDPQKAVKDAEDLLEELEDDRKKRILQEKNKAEEEKRREEEATNNPYPHASPVMSSGSPNMTTPAPPLNPAAVDKDRAQHGIRPN